MVKYAAWVSDLKKKHDEKQNMDNIILYEEIKNRIIQDEPLKYKYIHAEIRQRFRNEGIYLTHYSGDFIWKWEFIEDQTCYAD